MTKILMSLLVLSFSNFTFADCKQVAKEQLLLQMDSENPQIHYFSEINVNTEEALSENEVRNLLDNGWQFLMIATTVDEDGIKSSKKEYKTTVFPAIGEDGEFVCSL